MHERAWTLRRWYLTPGIGGEGPRFDIRHSEVEAFVLFYLVFGLYEVIKAQLSQGFVYIDNLYTGYMSQIN
jgi:hypothetical protein